MIFEGRGGFGRARIALPARKQHAALATETDRILLKHHPANIRQPDARINPRRAGSILHDFIVTKMKGMRREGFGFGELLEAPSQLTTAKTHARAER
jgi:hypothetical protein